jgi:hypothetical protein
MSITDNNENSDLQKKGPENSDNSRESSDISKDMLRQQVMSELNSLKAEIEGNKDAESDLRDFLGNSKQNNQRENNDDDNDRYYEKTFHIRDPKTQYNHARKLFPNFVAKCEASTLGKNFAYDVAGFLLGAGESLVDAAKFSIDMLGDALSCIRALRSEIRRTKQIIQDNGTL